MEIRDGLIKEYHPWRYIQFLLYFPTISSGPIDRYRRFEKDLLNPPTKEVYLDYLNKGVAKIMLGLLYKFILGYYLGQVLLPIVTKEALQNGLFSWGCWVICMFIVCICSLILLAIVCLRLVSATSWVMIHQLTSINLFWRLISKNSGIVGT